MQLYRAFKNCERQEFYMYSVHVQITIIMVFTGLVDGEVKEMIIHGCQRAYSSYNDVQRLPAASCGVNW